MCHYIRNHFKHMIALFKLYYTTKNNSSIMIAYDKQEYTTDVLFILEIECSDHAFTMR